MAVSHREVRLATQRAQKQALATVPLQLEPGEGPISIQPQKTGSDPLLQPVCIA